MVKPGGRLVAITGEGFAPEAKSTAGLFKDIGNKAQIAGLIHVDGTNIYKKYCTTFSNQLIVLDKTGEASDTSKIVRKSVDTIPDLINALEDIRNARPPIQGRPVADARGRKAGDEGARHSGSNARVPGDANLSDKPGDSDGVLSGSRQDDSGTVPSGAKRELRKNDRKDDLGRRSDAEGVSKRDASGSVRTDKRGVRERSDPDRLVTEKVTNEKAEVQENETFSSYVPSVSVKGAKPQPTKLVGPMLRGISRPETAVGEMED